VDAGSPPAEAGGSGKGMHQLYGQVAWPAAAHLQPNGTLGAI